MVLLDFVSLLLLSAPCVLPRKGSLTLRSSGMKMGLGLLSMLQKLLQIRCASLAVCTALSHSYVFYVW